MEDLLLVEASMEFLKSSRVGSKAFIALRCANKFEWHLAIAECGGQRGCGHTERHKWLGMGLFCARVTEASRNFLDFLRRWSNSSSFQPFQCTPWWVLFVLLRPTTPPASVMREPIGEAIKRSYVEVLVGPGQCTANSKSLRRRGYAKPNARVSQAQKANNRGEPLCQIPGFTLVHYGLHIVGVSRGVKRTSMGPFVLWENSWRFLEEKWTR